MNTLLKKTNSRKLSRKKLDTIRSDMYKAHNSFESGLSRHALYKTNNVEVSQDLVQTTFLKTLLYLQNGGRVIIMRRFLNHILDDLIVDEYRKNKTMSLEILLEKGFEPSFDDRERIINIFEGKQIVLLIPLLPKKYQSVIRMRYIKSLSLKEMSLITGQSQNTLAVQAHRGLEKLKVFYEESNR